MAKADATRHRRAMVLASVVLLIAGINMLVLGIVIGGGSESRVASLRIETLKAFLAAESGAHIAAGELSAGRMPPSTRLTLPSGETLDIAVSGSALPYTCTINGRFGQGQREIELHVE